MTFLIAGLDEVGRGALAGPLIAVAAAFYENHNPHQSSYSWNMEHCPIEGVDDSKKLTAKQRQEVFTRIVRSNKLFDFGIGEVSAKEIDNKGIEWANGMAFNRAVEDLKQPPDYVLIDGLNPLQGWDVMNQQYKPKADGLWWQVGAASILAKVIRDSFMAELGNDFPSYNWKNNVGYGSEEHRAAIIKEGPCFLHRTKFISGLLATNNI